MSIQSMRRTRSSASLMALSGASRGPGWSLSRASSLGGVGDEALEEGGAVALALVAGLVAPSGEDRQEPCAGTEAGAVGGQIGRLAVEASILACYLTCLSAGSWSWRRFA